MSTAQDVPAVHPKPTAEQATRLQELAVETAQLTATFHHWLDTELPKEWATFVIQALSEADLAHSTRYDFPDFARGFYDALTPGADGITYTGEINYCGESERDSFTIPWDFINPATSVQAAERILADLRNEKVEKDAAAAKNAERQAAHQRKEAVKQLERLAASLDMKVVEA